jgi:hypothetical protein
MVKKGMVVEKKEPYGSQTEDKVHLLMGGLISVSKRNQAP